MALTPRLENSQDFVQVTAGGADKSVDVTQTFIQATTGGPGGSIDLSQSFIQSVVNVPTKQLQQTQQFVQVAIGGADNSVDLTQTFIQVVVGGLIDDPVVRAWTFTLDGHDFYVLNLGDQETLIYDLSTGQWHTWSSGDSGVWRAYQGANWEGGMRFANEYGSNVLVGDNPSGALYLLNPDLEQDDGALEGSATVPFLRRAMGQLPVSGNYSRRRVGMVELLGSIGRQIDATLTGITLRYSDDRGNSYVDAGTVTVNPGDTKARVRWRSLGALRQPGRIFEIQDYGTLTRIDSLRAVMPDMEG